MTRPITRAVVHPGTASTIRPGRYAGMLTSADPGVRGVARVATVQVVAVAIATIVIAGDLGGPTGALLAFAVVAGLLLFARGQWRSLRIEWDGRELVQRARGTRATLGVRGEGTVVRAEVTLLGAQGSLGVVRYWLDADGRLRGITNDAHWDPAALDRLIAQAQIPVVDLGRRSRERLVRAYPQLAAAFGASRRTIGFPETLPIRGRGLVPIPGGRMPLWIMRVARIAVVLAVIGVIAGVIRFPAG